MKRLLILAASLAASLSAAASPPTITKLSVAQLDEPHTFISYDDAGRVAWVDTTATTRVDISFSSELGNSYLVEWLDRPATNRFTPGPGTHGLQCCGMGWTRLSPPLSGTGAAITFTAYFPFTQAFFRVKMF